jgi:hypothetical protein
MFIQDLKKNVGPKRYKKLTKIEHIMEISPKKKRRKEFQKQKRLSLENLEILKY